MRYASLQYWHLSRAKRDHADHLGNASWITDAAGKGYQHLQYLPFGESWVEQRCSGSYDVPCKFSGKELDAETGYNYFGARYYDSELSVWLSVDPMSDKYPNLSGLNYCSNNPLAFIDPNGMAIEKPIVWVRNKEGSLAIFELATNMPYSPGDNRFDVFVHSNHLEMYAETSRGQVRINTPEKFVALMCEESPEFKASLEAGENLWIVLHACETGADDDHKGNPISDPIAQKISECYPNWLVAAPDGKVVTSMSKDKSGKKTAGGNAHEKGVYDQHDSSPNANGGRGSYRFFVAGRCIGQDDSVGLPDAMPNNPSRSYNRKEQDEK